MSDDGGVATQYVSNNPSIIHPNDDDDALSQLPKTPTGEKNNNGCRRSSEIESTSNSNIVINNSGATKQARGREFCSNDDPTSAPAPAVVPLTEQNPQTTPKKQPSEGLFGGRSRGSGVGGFGSGKDGGDSPFADNNDDPGATAAAAALFNPVANPNICKDPFHPIPVCHKLVRSFSGDLDDVLFELARCYPLNLLGGCDLPKLLYCCATAYFDPLDNSWVGISCILVDPLYLPDPNTNRLDINPADNWDF